MTVYLLSSELNLIKIVEMQLAELFVQYMTQKYEYEGIHSTCCYIGRALCDGLYRLHKDA